MNVSERLCEMLETADRMLKTATGTERFFYMGERKVIGDILYLIHLENKEKDMTVFRMSHICSHYQNRNYDDDSSSCKPECPFLREEGNCEFSAPPSKWRTIKIYDLFALVDDKEFLERLEKAGV